MDYILNVIPDKADTRDFKASLMLPAEVAFPAEVDLRALLSAIVDQGPLGSCTANAIVSGLREYFILKSGLPLTLLSRLFLYWQERNIEGSINTDAGAMIRDGMKVLQQIGVSPEVDFPYVVDQFAVTPTEKAIKDAARFSITAYHRVMNFQEVQACLVAGFPVVLGFYVYDSFIDFDLAMTGMVPMPDETKETLQGGHAVLIVGYKKFSGEMYAIVRNSWGTSWGDHGYCYMPQAFIEKYGFDLWTGTDQFNTDQSIDWMTTFGILRSPEFWHPLVAKYVADPLSDFRYVGMAFQNIATYLRNTFGLVTLAPAQVSKFTTNQAIDFLAARGMLHSPDFWHNLVAKYVNDPASDLRYVGPALQNAATQIETLEGMAA